MLYKRTRCCIKKLTVGAIVPSWDMIRRPNTFHLEGVIFTADHADAAAKAFFGIYGGFHFPAPFNLNQEGHGDIVEILILCPPQATAASSRIARTNSPNRLTASLSGQAMCLYFHDMAPKNGQYLGLG